MFSKRPPRCLRHGGMLKTNAEIGLLQVLQLPGFGHCGPKVGIVRLREMLLKFHSPWRVLSNNIPWKHPRDYSCKTELPVQSYTC